MFVISLIYSTFAKSFTDCGFTYENFYLFRLNCFINLIANIGII